MLKSLTDDESVLHVLLLEQRSQCTANPKENPSRNETPGSILPTARMYLGSLRKEQRKKGVEKACSFFLSAPLP